MLKSNYDRLIEFMINHCTLFTQLKMARGHQKIQSQQKNAEKQAKMKKGQSSDQKKAAQAALVYSCAVCKACIFVFSLTLGVLRKWTF